MFPYQSRLITMKTMKRTGWVAWIEFLIRPGAFYHEWFWLSSAQANYTKWQLEVKNSKNQYSHSTQCQLLIFSHTVCSWIWVKKILWRKSEAFGWESLYLHLQIICLIILTLNESLWRVYIFLFLDFSLLSSIIF